MSGVASQWLFTYGAVIRLSSTPVSAAWGAGTGCTGLSSAPTSAALVTCTGCAGLQCRLLCLCRTTETALVLPKKQC